VNNPSEGTIAKRRSYAELISYLTPPIENAGLYKGLASLKELIGSYRVATDQGDREKLFAAIQQQGQELNFNLTETEGIALGARTSRPHRVEGETVSSS
jgi:magnesium chelatase subunit H